MVKARLGLALAALVIPLASCTKGDRGTVVRAAPGPPPLSAAVTESLCVATEGLDTFPQAAERRLLATPGVAVARSGGVLTIRLLRSIPFVLRDSAADDSTTGRRYWYLGFIEALNRHLVRELYWQHVGEEPDWEDRVTYGLINASSGFGDSFPACPAFSPDQRHFALSVGGVFDTFLRSAEIWGLAGDTLALEWRYLGGGDCPCSEAIEPSWLGNDTVEVGTVVDSEVPPRAHRIRVVRSPTGWTLVGWPR